MWVRLRLVNVIQCCSTLKTICPERGSQSHVQTAQSIYFKNVITLYWTDTNTHTVKVCRPSASTRTPYRLFLITCSPTLCKLNIDRCDGGHKFVQPGLRNTAVVFKDENGNSTTLNACNYLPTHVNIKLYFFSIKENHNRNGNGKLDLHSTDFSPPPQSSSTELILTGID